MVSSHRYAPVGCKHYVAADELCRVSRSPWTLAIFSDTIETPPYLQGTKVNSRGKEMPHGTRLYSIAASRYGDKFDGKTTTLCVRRATYWDSEKVHINTGIPATKQLYCMQGTTAGHATSGYQAQQLHWP